MGDQTTLPRGKSDRQALIYLIPRFDLKIGRKRRFVFKRLARKRLRENNQARLPEGETRRLSIARCTQVYVRICCSRFAAPSLHPPSRGKVINGPLPAPTRARTIVADPRFAFSACRFLAGGRGFDLSFGPLSFGGEESTRDKPCRLIPVSIASHFFHKTIAIPVPFRNDLAAFESKGVPFLAQTVRTPPRRGHSNPLSEKRAMNHGCSMLRGDFVLCNPRRLVCVQKQVRECIAFGCNASDSRAVRRLGGFCAGRSRAIRTTIGKRNGERAWTR